MFLPILHLLKCVFYSLFKDRVPYRDGQQAVNIVGNGASLYKKEHCYHHCHTHAQPGQGMAGYLHIKRQYEKCDLTRHSSLKKLVLVEGIFKGKEREIIEYALPV